MPNPIVHGVINTIGYVTLAFLLVFPLTWTDWGWMVLAGIFFDVDHAIYYLVSTRPLTIPHLKERMRVDYGTQIPHFYVCHNLEFLVVLCSIYLGSGGIAWLMWVFAGWSIHLGTDAVAYMRHYHSFQPWAQYWNIGYYYIKRKREQPS